MRRIIVLGIGLTALAVLLTSEIWARGGRGGGGGRVAGAGGGMSMGGGGYRPGGMGGAAGRTPAMSRPATPSFGRPSSGLATGGAYGVGSRSAMGNLPTPSPRRSGSMSSRGIGPSIATRPSTQPITRARPNFGSLPSAGSMSGGSGRAASRDLPNFADLPALGSGNLGFGSSPNRPSNSASGIAGGVLAGGAAAQFLHESGGDFLADPSLPGGAVSRAFQNMPNREDKPAAAERPANGRPDRAGDRADNGKPRNPDAQPNRPKAAELAQSRPNRIADGDKWDQWRLRRLATVSKFMDSYCGDCDDWYGNEWWNNLHIPQPYIPGFDHWGSVTWPTMSSAIQSGSTNPIYYVYGDNVYYQNGSVYYGDKPVAAEDEYAKQAEAIAASAPQTKPDPKDWMPLGVFALSTDGEPNDTDPNFFLQLAISKQGALSGTLQSMATKTVQPVEGMVDKQTQRAAWNVVDKPLPVMETGAANLTQGTTSALVHFADGTTQKCLLVRINKPGSAKDATRKE